MVVVVVGGGGRGGVVVVVVVVVVVGVVVVAVVVGVLGTRQSEIGWATAAASDVFRWTDGTDYSAEQHSLKGTMRATQHHERIYYGGL
jgi:predicted metalloprotease